MMPHDSTPKISEIIYPELKTTQKLSFCGENFLIWKLKLSFVLHDHPLLHVLHPPATPPPTDPKWVQDESAARHLILETVDEHIFLDFLHNQSSAKTIIYNLDSRFNRPNITHRMNLFSAYKNHKMPSNGHVNQHIFRMRAMAKQLEFAGVNLPDELQAAMLMNSMPEEWEDELETLIQDLGSGEEEMSFDNVSKRLRVVSEIREWRELKNKTKIGLIKGRCYICGKSGHYRSDCPNKGTQKDCIPLRQIFEATSFNEIVYVGLKTTERLNYTGLTFIRWKRDLEEVFSHNGIAYILKDPKPEEPNDPAADDHESCHKKWEADDLLGRHLILAAMDDDLFLSFHDYPSAKDIMEALTICFGSSSIALRMLLLNKYATHRMSADTDIIEHIIDMDIMVSYLDQAGVKTPDELKAVVLMDSLPKSWEDSMTAVRVDMNMDEEDGLSLANVISRVKSVGALKQFLKHENKNRCSSNIPYCRSKNVRRGNCYSCGKPGHYQSDCPGI